MTSNHFAVLQYGTHLGGDTYVVWSRHSTFASAAKEARKVYATAIVDTSPKAKESDDAISLAICGCGYVRGLVYNQTHDVDGVRYEAAV